ncbi:hypothetical protein [uncultured Mycobacterium sp.]|uniref:hypothetical protein n=1 Tax=uncultured Mycobacterium sp. TaxID=171292 RepID=UPI0035CAC120
MGGNRNSSDQGTISDLPWASVFDPAANVRALSAIQAEGFRAASRIVDRFVRAVGSDVEESDGQAATNDSQAGIPEWERLTRAWWSMAGQFLLSSMPSAIQQGSGTVALDVNNPDAKGALNLEAPVGGSASAEVWLHNRGPDDRADVRLRCSDLLSHEGDVIHAGAVVIDTAVVPMLRRSSRGVTIRIDVAPKTRPGIYRGTVLASGHPDLWLPVQLTVRLPST